MRKSLIFIINLVFLTGLLTPPFAAAAEVNPESALRKLVTGNGRFVTGNVKNPRQDATYRKASMAGQNPFAAILSCSDSRVPVEILFDQGLGDLFIVRVAGNTPDEYVWASLEFAVNALQVPLIAVIGHEKCGAVAAAMGDKKFPGALGKLIKAIRKNLKERTCDPKASLACGIGNNVAAVVAKFSKFPSPFADRVRENKLKVVGGVYDLKTGWVLIDSIDVSTTGGLPVDDD
ncbi:MAG: carbonic anhydrase, partial [bacterium]|nr:carbonic anhydrase [bacterium]